MSLSSSPRIARVAFVAALLTMPLLAACSDDDNDDAEGAGTTTGVEVDDTTETGVEPVCAAASEFESALQGVRDVDVVEEGTDGLSSAVDTVSTALEDLQSEAQADFGDQVDAVQSSFDALSEAISGVSDDGSAQEIAEAVGGPISDFVNAADTLLADLTDSCE